MKRVHNILSIVAFCACVSACDPASIATYKIVNQTPGVLKIHYITRGKPENDTSTQFVSAGTTVVVGKEEGLGYVESRKEKSDTLYIYSRLDVFKNDTIPSKKNFKLTKYWTFEKKGKFSADYVLSIREDDF
jgi:hypothetical protein